MTSPIIKVMILLVGTFCAPLCNAQLLWQPPFGYQSPLVYYPPAPAGYVAYWQPWQGPLGAWHWRLVYVYVPPQQTKTADNGEETPAQPTDWPYCCCADIAVGNAGGSATLVGIFASGKTGLCITAAHVCENGGPIRLTFPGGYKCSGKLLGTDSRNDLAAIEIPVQEGMKTPRRVRAARESDGVVIAVGYPWYGQGTEHWTQGKYLGYSQSDAHFAARPFLHSGFSGGALFSTDGDYLGSTNGYGTDYSYAASGAAIEKFCRRWMKEGVGAE